MRTSIKNLIIKTLLLTFIFYSINCSYSTEKNTVGYNDIDIFSLKGIKSERFYPKVSIKKDDNETIKKITFTKGFSKKKLNYISENIYSSGDNIFSSCRISTHPKDSVYLYLMNDTLSYYIVDCTKNDDFIELFAIRKLSEKEFLVNGKIIEKFSTYNTDILSFVKDYKFSLKDSYGYKKYSLNLDEKKIYCRYFNRAEGDLIMYQEWKLKYFGSFYFDALVYPEFLE